MVTRLSLTAAAVSLALALSATQSGLSAQPSPPQQPNMMKMHEQMMAEMKAGDAKLDALVKEMNTAPGDAMVNAVAAVVGELVRQHRATHERMGQMHQQMMGGRGRMMRR